ncbi:chitin deacetylase [Mycena floridula]|nr:chitin deacetylase [Mycena floridula]
MLFTLLLIPLVSAGHLTRRHENHEHFVRKSLPSTWYHDESHPVHELFRRADAITFAAVGSDGMCLNETDFHLILFLEWRNVFPTGWATPAASTLPKAWVDALNAAVASGAIPNIPQSSSPDVGVPSYPNGLDPGSPEICSSSVQCRAPGDIWQAPDNHVALNFDDGPTEATPKLVDFLKAHGETATHFMIGSNIVSYPDQFLEVFNNGGDIAVHTWSHPQLTVKSNLEVLAELGWCMQAIYLSTKGRLPRFYRPPTGDADNRVRAIAKEIFGLEIVLWNQDTNDWTMGMTPPGTTMADIAGNMYVWLQGPKSPGLMILEHELTDATVSAFIAAYPVMKANNWTTGSAALLLDAPSPYWNSAPGANAAVVPGGLLDFAGASASAVGQTTAKPSSTTGSTNSTAKTTATSAKTSGTNIVNNHQGSDSNSALPLSTARALGSMTVLIISISFYVI